MSPSGRHILITGGSAGIGRAAALLLAVRGARVSLVSNVPDELRQVTEAIRARGGTAEWREVDLADPLQVAAVPEWAERSLGPLDALVNNAGMGLHATLLDTTDENLRRVFEVNFFAAVQLARECLRRMATRGRGHLVFVSSASARRGLARMGAYAPSKAAIHAFCQVLRLEASPLGVHVTEILPISVRTGFFQASENRADRPYRPRGLVQTPEHVARAVLSALEHPRAEIYPSWISHWALALDAVFPNLSARLLDWTERRASHS